MAAQRKDPRERKCDACARWVLIRHRVFWYVTRNVDDERGERTRFFVCADCRDGGDPYHPKDGLRT